jgi:tripartite-type tricarboxylate transporter receptor subunit TctC
MIKFLRCIAFGVSLFAFAAESAMAADAYPSRAIRLIVPFSAGGGTDAIARLVAQSLAKRLSQPVVVDNRPGAGGSIGTIAVTQAPADGYTLLLGTNATMVLNPLLQQNVKYKLDKDLVAVGGIASVSYLIAANPQFAAWDIKGLIELAKTKPGQVTYASPGTGTTGHLVGVLLESAGKVNMTHVPYRGAAPAMNDVVSGQVNFVSGDFSTLMPMVKSGKLRPLAVTGSQRVAALPDVPTVAEALPGFEAIGIFGILAPQGTPSTVIDRLSTELAHVLAEPEVVKWLQEIGGTPMVMKPDAIRGLLATETTKWKRVITDNKITVEALQ